MVNLSYKDLVDIHNELVTDFATDDDPIIPSGVKDDNLLHSAAFRPHTSIGENFKYPTVEMASSALLYGIIHDHPFYNGNKRTALVAILILLDLNGMTLTCNEDNLFKFVLQVAQHRIVKCDDLHFCDRESQYIARWIHDNAREIMKGENPLPYRKLRRILIDFECQIEQNGNKLNIKRSVEKRTFFIRRKKIKELNSQIPYYTDGKEVGKGMVKKIREDLELDESNGIDSSAFYLDSYGKIDDFIAKYSKILKRLSKL